MGPGDRPDGGSGLAYDEDDPPVTMDALLEWRRAVIAAEGGPLFLGLPDRWYDAHAFRCLSGHVSTRILKSEVKGDLCLACLGPVCLTFPEDSDGPLQAIPEQSVSD